MILDAKILNLKHDLKKKKKSRKDIIGFGSPPVKTSLVSSHFYPDELHVLNATFNGRKYSTLILSKPPPPRLHLGFRPNHHHHLVIYTRAFPQFFEEKREMREK